MDLPKKMRLFSRKFLLKYNYSKDFNYGIRDCVQISLLNLRRYKRNVYPTFTKLKQFQNMEREHHDRYYKRLILHEIGNKKQIPKTN